LLLSAVGREPDRTELTLPGRVGLLSFPRLLQIFANIIKNGVKFPPEGGSITIRTSNYEGHRRRAAVMSPGEESYSESDNGTEDEEDKGVARRTTRREMVRIDITDTGTGIAGQILPHLFHAFEQGDTSITVRFGGLGLGLAIARYAYSHPRQNTTRHTLSVTGEELTIMSCALSTGLLPRSTGAS
jgi:signal transduction histidine kinase